MPNYPVVYKIAGEYEGFLNCSKTGYERLGRVVVEYNVMILGIAKFGDPKERGSTFVASLRIPAQYLTEVEEILKTELTDPPDTLLGSDIYHSIKWMDEDGVQYTSPYPSKEMAVGAEATLSTKT
jgi:hypothetical protein